MNGPAEEQVGSRTVVAKFIWLFFLVSSVIRINFPWLMKLSGRGFMIYDKCVPCRGSVFRQIRGAQRKRLSVFAAFKVPTQLKTIRMPKWHTLRWYILLPLSTIAYWAWHQEEQCSFLKLIWRGRFGVHTMAPSRNWVKTTAGRTKCFPYSLFPVQVWPHTELCNRSSQTSLPRLYFIWNANNKVGFCCLWNTSHSKAQSAVLIPC